jgi:FMN-dependent NADH-azoreductase
MTNILQLDSSVSGDASVTNRLSSLLVETLGAEASVTRRDLSTLPSLTADRFAANGTPAADRSPAQAELGALGDDVIAELEGADILVISAPVYNFGVPSGVKAWMDLAARAGRTFQYTPEGPEGLVTNKSAYIVSASGGVPLGSEMDFATPHIRTFLGFLGFTDITLIDAGGLLMDSEKVQKAEEQIRQLATA